MEMRHLLDTCTFGFSLNGGMEGKKLQIQTVIPLSVIFKVVRISAETWFAVNCNFASQ